METSIYLFIILPTGVVSKKDIGDLKMHSNIELCRIPEALTILVKPSAPKANIAAPFNVEKKSEFSYYYIFSFETL